MFSKLGIAHTEQVVATTARQDIQALAAFSYSILYRTFCFALPVAIIVESVATR
jgi:hypothetical protein